MIFWRKYKALFYDDKGNFIGEKGFSRKEKTFKYSNRSYNIILDCPSYLDRKALWFDKRYYYYSLNNPNPIIMDKKAEPILDAEVYNIMLETKVLAQLNELSRNNVFALFTPKNIIIILAIIGLAVYFGTGNTITGSTPPIP